MCKSSDIEGPRYHLSDFFLLNWEEYLKHPKVPVSTVQLKAAHAIMICRTEILGIDYYVCENCGEISTVYHSCKHRFCPRCSWADTLAWADRLHSNLLPIGHRHVVFTLPHSLNGLISRNKSALCSILFKTAAHTLMDWIKQHYHLTPGVVSVLHTFGEKKQAHHHVHMILSWGGLDDNLTLHELKGSFIDYDEISRLFRDRFLSTLESVYRSGGLKLRFKNDLDFKSFIHRLTTVKWCVHFEDVMLMPEQVIRYIGRYAKRACLSERKITNIEGEYITFKYKDNKEKGADGKAVEKELRLHYQDFFPLLLQHVPPAYFRLVRYYGAYSSSVKGKLNSLNITFEPKETHAQDLPNEDEQDIEETSPVDGKICAACGTVKRYLFTTFLTKEGEIIYMMRLHPKKKRDKPNSCAA